MIRDLRHRALVELLIAERHKAGLRQEDVAKKLGRYQSYIARIETGKYRMNVMEFLDLAEAIDFDPVDAVKRIRAAKRRPTK